MDILVVGAGGLLGSNLVTAATDRGLSIAGTYHSTPPTFDVPLSDLDIRNIERFRTLLEELDPSSVVNCAAMTDVDACEEQPELAQAINADAPEAMAHHCSERDTQFVHVSTDYVFDGKSDERYGEESDPNPIQVYGESKLEGDRGVLLAHRSPLLVRPSFVYGVNQTGEKPGLEGFPAWVRSQLVDSEEVPLLTDQYVTPSRAGATAETMLDLLEAGATGTYNVAARSCVTPYEFGWELVEQVAARESSLSRESQTDIKRSAARPTNTCLNVEKVESRLGRPQPTLGEDIASIASCL